MTKTYILEGVSIEHTNDDLFTVTLRGSADKIVKVLVNGLPYEAMAQLKDAITIELARRKDARDSPIN